MSGTNWQVYLEKLFRAWDPTVNLNPGSSIQTKVIGPLVSKLGVDPIDTDFETFVYDRLAQEHPEVSPVPGDALSDLLLGVDRTILEPLRREIALVQENRALNSATLTDEEADSLVSNFFTEPRAPGGYSIGYARIYFPNPVSMTFTRQNTVFSKTGLNFIVLGVQSISSQDMLLQEEDGLYYADILYQAESPGSGYNIGPNQLVGIRSMPNVVRVTNKRRFIQGNPRESTEALVARAKKDLTERSLNTGVGIGARFNQAYPGQIQFLDVLRYGDSDMNRDLLSGSGGVNIVLVGMGSFTSDVFMLVTSQEVAQSAAPAAGDRIQIFWPPMLYDLQADHRMEEYTIESVGEAFAWGDSGSLIVSPLKLSGAPTENTVTEHFPQVSSNAVVFFIVKDAPLSITALPGGIRDLSVPADQLHIGGHQDALVGTKSRDTGSASIRILDDEEPLVAGINLQVRAGSCVVSTADVLDFQNLGVRPQQALVIQSGEAYGVYRILMVSTFRLVVDHEFEEDEDDLKFFVSSWMHVRASGPRQVRIPFGPTRGTQLTTVVGSKILNTNTIDLVEYGAEIGDILLIESGEDQSDDGYTITGFLNGDGRRPVVQKAGDDTWTGMGHTATNLQYRVFKEAGDGVALPLVRVTKMELLDNEEQPSGIRVPYARPVMVGALSSFSGASVSGSSDLGIVCPKISAEVQDNAKIRIGDGEGIEVPLFALGDWAAEREPFFLSLPNLPLDVLMGALGSGVSPEFTAPVYPDPVLSTAVQGDAFSIYDGPNRGYYTIKEVDTRTVTWGSTSFKITFVTIEEEFPSPDNELIQRLAVDVTNESGDSAYANIEEDFSDEAEALEDLGFPSAGDVAPEQVAALASHLFVHHACGSLAQGKARFYFMEPTTAEFRNFSSGTGEDRLVVETEGGLRFHLDRNQRAQLYPERTIDDIRNLPRGMTVTQVHPGEVVFEDVEPLLNGLQEGDQVLVHEGLFLQETVPVICTTAGSNVITIPDSCPITFRNTRPGFILSIEGGDDEGDYLVVEVINQRRAKVDRLLTTSTPAISHQGSGATLTVVDGVVTLADTDFLGTDDGKYVALLYHPTVTQGHRGVGQEITAATEHTSVQFSSTDFVNGAGCSWVVFEEEATLPTCRIYNSSPTVYDVCVVSSEIVDCPVRLTRNGSDDLTNYNSYRQPYRWVRPGCTRISELEMEGNNDQGLFYVDLVLVSEGPDEGFNIAEGTPLQPQEGTYYSEGYVLEPGDDCYSYSDEEELTIKIRPALLPSGSEDLGENLVMLPTKGIRVDYESSSLVGALQSLVESDAERICVANTLVRHMFPALVYISITYSGGATPSILEPLIRDLIETTLTTNRLEVGDIEAIVSGHGASYVDQNINLVALYCGKDRVWRGERTRNALGGAEDVPFLGNSRRLCCYISGKNRANETSVVIGERTTLVQL